MSKEAAEAYEVLSNNEKRQRYDQFDSNKSNSTNTTTCSQSTYCIITIKIIHNAKIFKFLCYSAYCSNFAIN